MTLEKFEVNAQELSVRARVSPATLSEFRNDRREINTSSLQRILNELDPEAFVYWLDIMRESETMISTAKSDPYHAELHSDALLALVDTYARRCTTDEQLALLRVIYLACDANPNLKLDEGQ
ncbi:hypothetical protein PGN35_008450 [Nodosilinea sp. PGN35]